LKAGLRWRCGLKSDRTARVVIRGNAFIQNRRHGHHDHGVEVPPVFRLVTAVGKGGIAIKIVPPAATIPHAA